MIWKKQWNVGLNYRRNKQPLIKPFKRFIYKSKKVGQFKKLMFHVKPQGLYAKLHTVFHVEQLNKIEDV